MNVTLVAAVTTGAALVLGVVLVGRGLWPGPERLAIVFSRLDGAHSSLPTSDPEPPTRDWRAHLPLLPGTRKRLATQGRSPAEHYEAKLVGAGIGFALPLLVLGAAALVVGYTPLIPAGVGFVGAIIGFFAPDVTTAKTARTRREDSAWALLTYVDLVTLERLANQSAPQALAAAAAMSDHPLFLRLRERLEVARLEQRPPYAELVALADELELPELADVAAVMRLDESGAALAETLRARSAELRNAHLARAKIAAHAATERLTVLMVVPSLLFALIFLAPPLLRLVSR